MRALRRVIVRVSWARVGAAHTRVKSRRRQIHSKFHRIDTRFMALAYRVSIYTQAYLAQHHSNP
jgi:hypothetical protein